VLDAVRPFRAWSRSLCACKCEAAAAGTPLSAGGRRATREARRGEARRRKQGTVPVCRARSVCDAVAGRASAGEQGAGAGAGGGGGGSQREEEGVDLCARRQSRGAKTTSRAAGKSRPA